jgi:hypothetical protein
MAIFQQLPFNRVLTVEDDSSDVVGSYEQKQCKLSVNQVPVRMMSTTTLTPKAIDILRCNMGLAALPAKYKSKSFSI